jgi:hypothetical protein
MKIYSKRGNLPHLYLKALSNRLFAAEVKCRPSRNLIKEHSEHCPGFNQLALAEVKPSRLSFRRVELSGDYDP